MKDKKHTNRLPKGWTAEKINAIIKYYDDQTEEDAAKEIETAFNNPDNCTISVPKKLLPKIRKLLAATHG
jgi:hypothetical protein